MKSAQNENTLFDTRKNNLFLRGLFEAIGLTYDVNSHLQRDICHAINAKSIELSDLTDEAIDDLKEMIVEIYMDSTIKREEINHLTDEWERAVIGEEVLDYEEKNPYDALQQETERLWKREDAKQDLTQKEEKLFEWLREVKAIPSKLFDGHFYYTIEVVGESMDASKIANQFRNEGIHSTVVRPRIGEGEDKNKVDADIHHVRIDQRGFEHSCPHFAEKIKAQYASNQNKKTQDSLMKSIGKDSMVEDSFSTEDLNDIHSIAASMKRLGVISHASNDDRLHSEEIEHRKRRKGA